MDKYKDEQIEILEQKEVCEMLRISRPTLFLLPIPRVRIGKRDKYLKSDVFEFLDRQKIVTDFKREAQKIKKNMDKTFQVKIEKYKHKFSEKKNNTGGKNDEKKMRTGRKDVLEPEKKR